MNKIMLSVATIFCFLVLVPQIFGQSPAPDSETLNIEVPDGGSFWFMDNQMLCPPGTPKAFTWLEKKNPQIKRKQDPKTGEWRWISDPGVYEVNVVSGCALKGTVHMVLAKAPRKHHAPAPRFARFFGPSAWWWPLSWIVLSTLGATVAILKVVARSKRAAALRVNPNDPTLMAEPMIRSPFRRTLFPLLPAAASDVEAAHQRAVTQIAQTRPVGTHTDTWNATCAPNSDVNAAVEGRRGSVISTMRSGNRYAGSLKVYRDIATGRILNVSFVFRVCANTFREMNGTDAETMARSLSWPFHNRIWMAAQFEATSQGQLPLDTAWAEIETWVREHLVEILASSSSVPAGTPITLPLGGTSATVMAPTAPATSSSTSALACTSTLSEPAPATTALVPTEEPPSIAYPLRPASERGLPVISQPVTFKLTRAQQKDLAKTGSYIASPGQIEMLSQMGVAMIVMATPQGMRVQYLGYAANGLPTQIEISAVSRKSLEAPAAEEQKEIPPSDQKPHKAAVTLKTKRSSNNEGLNGTTALERGAMRRETGDPH